MKTLYVTLFLLVTSLLAGCNNDEEVAPGLQAFVGDYTVVNIETSGLHGVFDSLGNVDYIITTDTTTDDLNMRLVGTDSLELDGLLGTANNHLAKASLAGDTLRIHYEFGDNIRNEYIRGKIWQLGTDSIQLEYRWDRSDTWTQEAIPIYGRVVARGVRL